MLKGKLSNGAGKRDTFVTVQRATDAPVNDVNEVLPEWSDLGDYFAGEKPTYGREVQIAMQTRPMLKAIMELPYDSVTATITPRDRIIANGKTLNIDAVFNKDGANESIVVFLIEEVQC